MGRSSLGHEGRPWLKPCKVSREAQNLDFGLLLGTRDKGRPKPNPPPDLLHDHPANPTSNYFNKRVENARALDSDDRHPKV